VVHCSIQVGLMLVMLLVEVELNWIYSFEQFFDIDPSRSPMSKWPDIIVTLVRSVPYDLGERCCFRDVCSICRLIRVRCRVRVRVVVFESRLFVFLDYQFLVPFLQSLLPLLLPVILSAVAK